MSIEEAERRLDRLRRENQFLQRQLGIFLAVKAVKSLQSLTQQKYEENNLNKMVALLSGAIQQQEDPKRGMQVDARNAALKLEVVGERGEDLSRSGSRPVDDSSDHGRNGQAKNKNDEKKHSARAKRAKNEERAVKDRQEDGRPMRSGSEETGERRKGKSGKRKSSPRSRSRGKDKEEREKELTEMRSARGRSKAVDGGERKKYRRVKESGRSSSKETDNGKKGRSSREKRPARSRSEGADDGKRERSSREKRAARREKNEVAMKTGETKGRAGSDYKDNVRSRGGRSDGSSDAKANKSERGMRRKKKGHEKEKMRKGHSRERQKYRTRSKENKQRGNQGDGQKNTSGAADESRARSRDKRRKGDRSDKGRTSERDHRRKEGKRKKERRHKDKITGDAARSDGSEGPGKAVEHATCHGDASERTIADKLVDLTSSILARTRPLLEPTGPAGPTALTQGNAPLAVTTVTQQGTLQTGEAPPPSTASNHAAQAPPPPPRELERHDLPLMPSLPPFKPGDFAMWKETEARKAMARARALAKKKSREDDSDSD